MHHGIIRARKACTLLELLALNKCQVIGSGSSFRNHCEDIKRVGAVYIDVAVSMLMADCKAHPVLTCSSMVAYLIMTKELRNTAP